MRKKMLLSLAALTMMSLVVTNAYACMPGLSPGYWKHNVKVYCGGPGHYSAPFPGYPHETDASMLNYATTILGWDPTPSDLPPEVHTPEELLAWANGIFQDQAYNHMWLIITNWFNEAAGYSDYSG
jgi:hypothetical protein